MSDLRIFLEDTFAAAGGEMPFEAYMAAALYHPEHGYYTAGIAEVGGKRGDFATSATLSDGLGRAIAGWIGEEITHHGWKGPVAVIEVGGGNGALAATVLKALGWWRRRQIRYHLVEVSPVLRQLQQRRLGRSVKWHDSPVAALESVGGAALIFSNELVDAFPVKWLRREAGEWREIWVAYDREGGLREVCRERSAEVKAEDHGAMRMADPVVGQRIEILTSYRQWLGSLATAWRGGSMLTIDYGASTAEAVYNRRPSGTMRAYHGHERLEGGGIYRRFGKQDLTADVNFADLVAWGLEWGIETTDLSPQRDFLDRFGERGDTMADSGAGEAFLVLEQRRRICG